MIEGLDLLVYLEQTQHRYFHKVTGAEYMSVSKFLGLFKKSFDKNIAYNCAGKGDYKGMSAEEVLKYWELYGGERAAEGTRIHNSIELYSNTTEIEPKNEDLRPAILNITEKYKGYYRKYNEVVLHDDDEFICGTSDNVLIVSSHKDSPIDIVDWKTNKTGVNQVDLDKKGQRVNKQMLHCLSHLTDSKFNFYSLQLSMYAYMLQKQTGRKVGKLCIHYINPENPLINYQIPVNYMYYEIVEMLKWKRLNIGVTKESLVSEVPSPKSILNGFNSNNFFEEKKVIKDEFDLI